MFSNVIWWFEIRYNRSIYTTETGKFYKWEILFGKPVIEVLKHITAYM